MFDRKMLIPFTDSKGKSCDALDSYVEITKVSDKEYILKTYLSCGQQADYIVETLGCYDKCGCTTEEKVAEKPDTPIKHTKVITKYEYMKTLINDVWSAFGDWTEEYKAETDSLKREEKTIVRGKKLVSGGTYNYQYYRSVLGDFGGWSAWSTNYVAPSYYVQVQTRAAQVTTYSDWSNNWSAWSTNYVASSDTVEVQTRTNTVYGNWYFYQNKTSLAPLYDNDVTNYTLLDDNYLIRTCVNDCCVYESGYLYQVEKRSKSTVTEYSIRTRTKNISNVTEYSFRTRDYETEYTWSTSPSLSGWTRTGNYEILSSSDWVYTDWVDLNQLPAGYTAYTSKKLYRYSTKATTTQVKYTWSTSTSLSGWTKTGKTEKKTIYY
jgi:hypothetical protein